MRDFRLKLVASDMDGTILNAHHTLTPYTMETLYLLSLKKVPFVFCTGRHYLSVVKIYRELCKYFVMRNEEMERKDAVSNSSIESGTEGKHLTQPGFYLVSSNGGRLHSPTGQLLREHNMEPQIVKILYEKFGLPFTNKKVTDTKTLTQTDSHIFATSDGDVLSEIVSTSAYTTDKWYATATFLPMEEMEEKFGTKPYVPPFECRNPDTVGYSVFDSFPLEGVGKVCFRSSDRSLLAKFEKELLEMFGDKINVCFSSRFCLDVMKKGVSKASALDYVCMEINRERMEANTNEDIISMKNVVSFGDSMNDCEMLRRSGLGFIMSNAQQRLKEMLPSNEVIGHHNDDSVAKKLRKLFKIQE